MIGRDRLSVLSKDDHSDFFYCRLQRELRAEIVLVPLETSETRGLKAVNHIIPS